MMHREVGLTHEEAGEHATVGHEGNWAARFERQFTVLGTVIAGYTGTGSQTRLSKVHKKAGLLKWQLVAK